MTRVARNIMTPARSDYPPQTPETFKRLIEELCQAANGGSEGSDYIYNLINSNSELGLFITHLLGGIVQISGGGTGATTAAGAQINLELQPGVDIFAFDANLQAFIDANDLPETAGGVGQTIVADGAGGTAWGSASNTVTISDVTLTVTDSGGDDVYTVGWSAGAGVADGTHDLEIAVFKNGAYAGASSVTTPGATSSDVITVTGAADGVADFHHALLTLTDQSTGATLYTQAAFATATVVSALLMETGDYLLLETGDHILLES